MSKYLKILISLVVIVATGNGLGSGSTGDEKRATVTTICDLAKNPGDYSRRLVLVRAFILSDLLHSTVLVDSACEEEGVSFESEEYEGRPIELVKDEEYEKLEALHPKLLELRDKDQRLYGTFQGLFEWKPNHRPMKTLVLRRVTDLYIAHEDDPKYALKNK